MKEQLTSELMRQLQKGIEEFNAGRFFECHEILEDAWHEVRGSGRDFFQGLIQIAVGFYHLGNQNLRGGRSQLEKGLCKLEKYGESHYGIDLAGLRQGAADWLEKVRTGADLTAHVRDLPKIHFSA